MFLPRFVAIDQEIVEMWLKLFLLNHYHLLVGKDMAIYLNKIKSSPPMEITGFYPFIVLLFVKKNILLYLLGGGGSKKSLPPPPPKRQLDVK